MAIKLNAYLNFKDNTREAMEFYKGVFGGELTMSTFKEGGVPATGTPEDDRIMHAELKAENGINFFASDTPASVTHIVGDNISLSLSGSDEADLRDYWAKLSDGGTVDQPLEKAPWGDTFGMLTDKYGIHWMVDILGEK
jgi:PhnB protein